MIDCIFQLTCKRSLCCLAATCLKKLFCVSHNCFQRIIRSSPVLHLKNRMHLYGRRKYLRCGICSNMAKHPRTKIGHYIF
ncbi:hypothetical protein QE152_g5747 [Popillia japonica]|uniref:Secreted protein n=1 Tax=Popillia japonica TaxID=7064 RepID=A0AAW1MGV7_POPJA